MRRGKRGLYGTAAVGVGDHVRQRIQQGGARGAGIQRGRRQQVSLRQHDAVRGAELRHGFVHLGQRIGVARAVVGADHRQPQATAGQFRIGQRRDDGAGPRQAAAFQDHALQGPLALRARRVQQRAQGVDQVAAQRAADATIGHQRHRHVVAVVGHNGAVHADFSRLVDDHARIAGRRIAQVIHQQRGLAAAQKPAQEEQVDRHVRTPDPNYRKANPRAIHRTAGARHRGLLPNCP
ncbi:hypothetical protein D3C71_1500390 [compost metagenome]